MASFNDCLTKGGQSILAKMAAGKKITFTKVVVGDGIIDAERNKASVTHLIREVATLNVESVSKTADNKVTIRAILNNCDIAEGFYFREKGIYGTTDGTDECLISYANNGSKAEWIDQAATQLIEKVLRTIIIFAESDSINIAVSSAAYAPPVIISNYTTLEEFVSNIEVMVGDIEYGSDVIIGGNAYIYVGPDPSDPDSYHYYAGDIIDKIIADMTWHNSITTISEDGLILRTDYDDGSYEITTISSLGNMIVTTKYDKDGVKKYQMQTAINDKTIETRKVVD